MVKTVNFRVMCILRQPKKRAGQEIKDAVGGRANSKSAESANQNLLRAYVRVPEQEGWDGEDAVAYRERDCPSEQVAHRGGFPALGVL